MPAVQSTAGALRRRLRPRLPRLALAAVLVIGCACPARAQDLPVVTYTTRDGLPHDVVHRVFRDARGFLWLGTSSSLTRFDGERFTSYLRTDGLDTGTGINDIKEDPQGGLWIATNGEGIFRFDLTTVDRARRFTRLPIGEGRAVNRVNSIAVLPGNVIWAGTDSGLFVGSTTARFTRIPLPLDAGQMQESLLVTVVLADEAAMWVATSRGVFRCSRGAAPACTRGPLIGALSMLIDRSRQLWTAGASGVHVFRTDGTATSTPVRTVAVGARVRRLIAGSDGTMVAAIEDGRVLAIDGTRERVLFASSDAARIHDLAEDGARNLWVATNLGLVGIRRQGVTFFSSRHGLQSPHVEMLRADAGGRIYAQTDDQWLHRIDGSQLSSVRLLLPDGVRRSSWPTTATLVDSAGDVWLGTASGVLRYRQPTFVPDGGARMRPSEIYTRASGLAGDHISEVFEDPNRDVWIVNIPVAAESVTVWRRASGRFERIGAGHGLPPFNQPVGFIEDSRRALWARLREGGVVRIRDGRAAVFATDDGFPQLTSALLEDRQGRLWVGGPDGVLRVDDIGADRPRAVTVLDHLGSAVRALAEDQAGNLLIGTYEGVLSFDPRRGSLRRLSSFEGLPRANIDALMRAADGSVLAVTGRSLARLAWQAAEWWDSPPRCLLSALRVGDEAVGVPEMGLERVRSFEVPPDRNTVEIEYLGLSPRFGEPLEYEYRLSGVSESWTRSAERRVHYIGLAAGRYTFEVRATSAGGSVSAPAAVTFDVLPPWYRRWWFLSLLAVAGLAAGYAAHRARLAQAVRTERLRSRIATDLHDDIGSSLSQIAILAEVARRRAGETLPTVSEPLTSIATTSRDLVDAMSDIVWAVNPRTDSLSDLTRRMHRFAAETLGGADIQLTFTAPPRDEDMKLGADLRRELYLILKESVNNIARHSGATAATVELKMTRSELRLTIADNGNGFDPARPVDGNGIASMRKRAAAFGGALVIETGPGRGTFVSLGASLRGARY